MPPDTDPKNPGKTDWIARWVEPYLTDSSLFAVSFAILGHVSVLLALGILKTIRSGHPAGLLALVVVAFPSVEMIKWERRERGRPGALTGIVVATWAGGLGLAWIADAYGIY